VRQIEKVAAIDRQVLDLLRSEDALYRRLLGVDFNGGSLHLYQLVRLPDLQFGITRCGDSHLHGHRDLSRLEARGLDANRVISGSERSRSVGASRGRGYSDQTPVGLVINDDFRAADDRATGIGDRTLNTAG
jgi:hypothetical protein